MQNLEGKYDKQEQALECYTLFWVANPTPSSLCKTVTTRIPSFELTPSVTSIICTAALAMPRPSMLPIFTGQRHGCILQRDMVGHDRTRTVERGQKDCLHCSLAGFYSLFLLLVLGLRGGGIWAVALRDDPLSYPSSLRALQEPRSSTASTVKRSAWTGARFRKGSRGLGA